LDLTQFPEASLEACTVANKLQAVPTAMTGRIFYWNMTTFNKAGITEVPKTEDDLYAAGKAFKEKLGEDYYPLHLGAYDRMILMVFYLESKYGKDWADAETATLNYTSEEIQEGFNFIKGLVDNHVCMSLPTYYGSNGDTAANQSAEWIDGHLAGIFEWDSSAAKYQDALNDENKAGFTVGEEIKFGDYNGGYTKVATAFAITQTAKNPAEGAMVIDFILNDAEGAAIIGSSFGIPASTSGKAAAEAAGTLSALTAEANGKVLAFASNQLDPLFESTDLKGTPGVYQDVFDTIDYDGVTDQSVVDTLLDGMSAVGYNV
jgi:oligogalacturonide transport system substrate-binding protein